MAAMFKRLRTVVAVACLTVATYAAAVEVNGVTTSVARLQWSAPYDSGGPPIFLVWVRRFEPDMDRARVKNRVSGR